MLSDAVVEDRACLATNSLFWICNINYHNSHTIIFYYSETEKQKKKKQTKPAEKRKRTIKITELKAVYNCKSCGYRTMDRDLSSKHNCTKKPAQYIPCTKCDKYKAPEGYEQCTKCSYFTKTKASLKVHMRIHLKGTPYKCTECNYSGRDLKDLISHYKAKDLKCECGYTTHIRQQMVGHMRSHTGEKPFSCGVCSYSTADRAGLNRHLKKHEG